MKTRIKQGQLFNSNSYGKFKIEKVYSWDRIKIKFIDTDYSIFTDSPHILAGKIKDPYYPKYYGIGFTGEGIYKSFSHKKLHNLWNTMIQRGYCPKFKLKQPAYKNCSVVKRWHNFQNFCEDIIKMPNWNTLGYQLDKDLRVLGNKVYGPKYCSFVPQEINNLIIKHTQNKKDKLPYGVFLHKTGKYFAHTKKFTFSNGKQIAYFNKLKDATVYFYKENILYIKSRVRFFKLQLHSEVFNTLHSISYRDIFSISN